MVQLQPVLLVVALAVLVPSTWSFRKQNVAVTGKVLCNGRPEAGVRVKLWNQGKTGKGDEFAEGSTNGKGDFFLNGTAKALLGIKPELRVYSDCNDGNTPCRRILYYPIDKKYVNDPKGFTIGPVDITSKQSSEKRTCKEDS